MYIGHLALALAAKRLRPELPLVVLATTSVFADLVDGVLPLVGLEGWAGVTTHTLPAAAIWTLATFLVARAAWSSSAAALLAGLMLSHVLTDGLTSQLLAWPGGPRWGLQLYRVRPIDFALEAFVIVACWLFYRPGLRRGPTVAMVTVLLGLQAFFDLRITLG